MVIPKVQLNGLLWNNKGYEQASKILLSKFGKTSELVNGHIQNVLTPLTAGASEVRLR